MHFFYFLFFYIQSQRGKGGRALGWFTGCPLPVCPEQSRRAHTRLYRSLGSSAITLASEQEHPPPASFHLGFKVHLF
uniref:Uncharacterized protein n=1 Tax=Anguilla anguilla TaxID=7936 RepID=A0A0E9WNB6_ANGAN